MFARIRQPAKRPIGTPDQKPPGIRRPQLNPLLLAVGMAATQDKTFPARVFTDFLAWLR